MLLTNEHLAREHDRILRKLQGCIHLSELARLYFPHYSQAKYAKEALFKMIADTPELTEELAANGFVSTNGIQPPKINAILVRRLGWPDEVLLLEMKQKS